MKNKTLFASMALVALAACGGEEVTGGAQTSSNNGSNSSSGDSAGNQVVDVPPTGPDGLSYLLNSVADVFYVEEFDADAVATVRRWASFAAANLSAYPNATNHPVYDGSQLLETNPLTATGLDKAFSAGLSGDGVKIHVMDDGVMTSHQAFDGKTITIEGDGSDDYHGTAVVSVIVGEADDIQGFAPDAEIYFTRNGYSFGDGATDDEKGDYMRNARDNGAIISNNSWGLTNATVTSFDMEQRVINMGQYASGLRYFAETGVIVFSVQNVYGATSVEPMAGLPVGAPDLEDSWIAVVNAIPEFDDDDNITSAIRLSAGCLEAARWCVAAPGMIRVARNIDNVSQSIFLGSSYAAPQVSGALALLAEAFPNVGIHDLRKRLLFTANNSFYEHDGVVDFGNGMESGYNAEFGHGILDIGAALLPIGDLVVAQPNSGGVVLGQPIVVSGGASGNALKAALTDHQVVATDAFSGSFSTSADVLSAVDVALMSPIVADVSARDTFADLAIRRQAKSDASSVGMASFMGRDGLAQVSGAGSVALPFSDDLSFDVLIDGDGGTGLGVRRAFDVESGVVTLGLVNSSSDQDLLGLSVVGAGNGLDANATSLELAWQGAVAPKADLRIEAAVGFADASGAGAVNGFSDVTFNRVAAAIGFSDVAERGDHLSLFARAPIAFSSGSANMSLATGLAQDGTTLFTDEDLGLAPDARQLDLGFDYLVPLNEATNLAVTAAYSDNYGHVGGATNTEVGLGIQMRW